MALSYVRETKVQRGGRVYLRWQSGQTRTWTQVSLIYFLPHFPDTSRGKTDLSFLHRLFPITTSKGRMIAVTGIHCFFAILNGQLGAPISNMFLSQRLGHSVLHWVIIPLRMRVASMLH